MVRPAVGRGAAVAALIFLAAAPALAGVGVGVGRVPLTMETSVTAGRSYRLRPDFSVVNTGDRRTTYTLRVERLSEQDGSTLPTSWVALRRRRVLLGPGRQARIAVRVHVPRGAKSGTYVSDVVASGASGRGGSVSVGAAAVTPMSVTVAGRPGGLAAALGWPWSRSVEAAVGASAALLALWAVWRLLGFRLVVERHPGS